MFICLLIFQLRSRIHVLAAIISASWRNPLLWMEAISMSSSLPSLRPPFVFSCRKAGADEKRNEYESGGAAPVDFTGMGAVTYLPGGFLHYLSESDCPGGSNPGSILFRRDPQCLLLPSRYGRAARSLDFTKPELIVACPPSCCPENKILGGTVLVGMVLFWFAGIWRDKVMRCSKRMSGRGYFFTFAFFGVHQSIGVDMSRSREAGAAGS